MPGGECGQNLRGTYQLNSPQNRHGAEPDQHDRAEEAPHPGRSPALQQKQSGQDADRQGDDIGCEGRRDDANAFNSAEHRNGRRYHAVPVDQAGTEEAGDHQQAPAAAVDSGLLLLDQCGQGHDAAFALVVGSQDEDHIFQGDDHNQGPDHERYNAKNISLGGRDAVFAMKTLPHGIKGTGADIAEDHAQCGQGHPGQTGFLSDAAMGDIGRLPGFHAFFSLSRGHQSAKSVDLYTRPCHFTQFGNEMVDHE